MTQSNVSMLTPSPTPLKNANWRSSVWLNAQRLHTFTCVTRSHDWTLQPNQNQNIKSKQYKLTMWRRSTHCAQVRFSTENEWHSHERETVLCSVRSEAHSGSPSSPTRPHPIGWAKYLSMSVSITECQYLLQSFNTEWTSLYYNTWVCNWVPEWVREWVSNWVCECTCDLVYEWVEEWVWWCEWSTCGGETGWRSELDSSERVTTLRTFGLKQQRVIKAESFVLECLRHSHRSVCSWVKYS